MLVRILILALLFCALAWTVESKADGTGMAHASTLPCVQEPALLVIVALSVMAGIVIGAIATLITSR